MSGVWCVVRGDFHRKQFCNYFAIEMTLSNILCPCEVIYSILTGNLFVWSCHIHLYSLKSEIQENSSHISEGRKYKGMNIEVTIFLVSHSCKISYLTFGDGAVMSCHVMSCDVM